MSQAYESTVRLELRRARRPRRCARSTTGPRWCSSRAIVAHLCRIFFTGAFRRPRELNWIIGVTLLAARDLQRLRRLLAPRRPAVGHRPAHRVLDRCSSIPLVGTWLAFLVFGGEFPASDILTRLFVIHILHHPGRDRHPARRPPRGPRGGRSTRSSAGRGRREDNVVGSRLWPTYTAKSVGLFARDRGRARAARRPRADQPDLALRAVRPVGGEHRRAARLVHGLARGRAAARAGRLPPHRSVQRPGAVLARGRVCPGITFTLLYLWPFLERRVTHDHAEHHLLDRPRDRPMRTALGVGVLAFYVVLLLAGAQDIFAQHLDVSILTVTARCASSSSPSPSCSVASHGHGPATCVARRCTAVGVRVTR